MVRLRPALVVHYHEISLKRGNRPLFLRHLRRNVERALADTGPAAIEQLSGRILVDLEGHPAPEGARDRVAPIFGVTSVTLAYRAPPPPQRRPRARTPGPRRDRAALGAHPGGSRGPSGTGGGARSRRADLRRDERHPGLPRALHARRDEGAAPPPARGPSLRLLPQHRAPRLQDLSDAARRP